MAELVDATDFKGKVECCRFDAYPFDQKSVSRKGVGVRFPLWAINHWNNCRRDDLKAMEKAKYGHRHRHDYWRLKGLTRDLILDALSENTDCLRWWSRRLGNEDRVGSKAWRKVEELFIIASETLNKEDELC